MSSAQPGSSYGTRFVFTATGQAIYAGLGSPEGVQRGSVGDLYVQGDASGVNQVIWRKVTGTATTTGWQATGGAPADATYILQTADPALAEAQALSALATGLVKNTTGTGVLGIAEPDVDYVGPTSVIDGETVTTHRVGVTSLI